MFRPDPRKKQNLMSLLSAMKSGKEQEPPDGKLARTRKKKRPSVQKTKGSLQVNDLTCDSGILTVVMTRDGSLARLQLNPRSSKIRFGIESLLSK